MRKALKLRCENHIHEDGSEEHGQKEIHGCLFEDFHLPGKYVRIADRQPYFLDGLHSVSSGKVERIAGSNVGKDADLKFTVVALERRRPDRKSTRLNSSH